MYAVKESAYTMFILLFYTQVLGLSGTITGLIIGLSLAKDSEITFGKPSIYDGRINILAS